jgi:phosphodiesterase/alkaline phosphatase D-like protein
VDNLAVLTGDIHTFFAGDVTTTGRQGGTPVGVELVGGSATSLGIPEALNVPAEVLETVGPPANPHIDFFDLRRRGCGIVEVRPDELRGEFRVCDTLTRGAKPQTSARFVVESGVPTLNVVS